MEIKTERYGLKRRRRIRIPYTARSRTITPESGSTLIEALVAGAIVVLFLAEMYLANGRGLGMLKYSREIGVVSNSLQTRIEQMRDSTYAEITSGSYISGTNVLGTNQSSKVPVENFTEQIDVNTYPLPAGYPGTLAASSIEVVRSSNGTVTITGSGNGSLATAPAVEVDFTDTWTAEASGNTRSREQSIIISSQGIAGQNQ